MSNYSYHNVSKKANQLVIVFCGPSTCGKSTIVKEILNSYRSDSQFISVIVLDHFFYKENHLPKTHMRGKMISNWDLKNSIDWEAFYRRISETYSPVILIDGFIPFADDRTRKIVDMVVSFEYNINTDFDIALGRRIHRCKSFSNCTIPHDYLNNPFGSHLNYQCAYFHDVVWPEMVKHPEFRKPINWKKPLLVLSATDNFNSNFLKTMKFLKNHLDFYID